MLSSGMGLRRGWPGGCYWKMEPRKGMQREETEVPGVSTKEVEAIQAPLGNCPESRRGKNRSSLTHSADGLSCQEVPGTQHLLMHRGGLAFVESVFI